MNHLTAAQYAAYVGVTPRRARAWIAEGRIPAEKFGRDWMIPEGTPRPADNRLVENPIRNRRKK
jgi:excisionase family DNA binding protein